MVAYGPVPLTVSTALIKIAFIHQNSAAARNPPTADLPALKVRDGHRQSPYEERQDYRRQWRRHR